MKKILGIMIALIWMLTSQLGWAGPLVFGPRVISKIDAEPQREIINFEVADSTKRYWLQVINGKDGKNLTRNAIIYINGVQVAGPQDLNQSVEVLQKNVVLEAHNLLELELHGFPNSVLTVQVRAVDLEVD